MRGTLQAHFLYLEKSAYSDMSSQIHHDDSSRLELVEPGQRNLVIAACRNDTIVGRAWRIAIQPIACIDGYTLAYYVIKLVLRTLRNFSIYFHRKYLVSISYDMSQQRCIIACTCPYFQHVQPRAQLQRF